jgi:hypothetical protein
MIAFRLRGDAALVCETNANPLLDSDQLHHAATQTSTASDTVVDSLARCLVLLDQRRDGVFALIHTTRWATAHGNAEAGPSHADPLSCG